MKNLARMTLVGVLLFAATPVPAENKVSFERLIGSWILVSAQETRNDGKIATPYGPKAKGILNLEASGRFVFVVVNPDIPRVAYAGQNPTPDDAMAITKGSLSFFGSYKADEGRSLITLSIEASSFPNLSGSDSYYYVDNLAGDDLTIHRVPPPGGGPVLRLVYKRNGAAPGKIK